MVPTAELAPLEPSKGFVEENGVAWPQAAPVHVKTKSAWATNSAMEGVGETLAFLAAFRAEVGVSATDRQPLEARGFPVRRAVAAVVAGVF